ncbi:hypothetical protein HBI95_221750 [Parastagonospora nodorum]|nr:hypothetical protein HBI95_221750 [Parastagonospora nodorum]KAH5773644.1 hypothetical protein HBI16_107030 [Parastagonospora nodorum]KAH6059055.1 hypothetical protein HBI67_172480 [Parastagonospora nodorum]KAH6069153.1 hypothetical protein HBI66_137640 [Parastagonospora nodorum]
MSHSITNRSEHSNDRISWLSLPITNHHDESEIDEADTQRRRLSSPSPVSRSQSQRSNDGMPGARDITSPQLPIESDELLQADRGTTRDPSISSTGVDSSLNKVPRAVASDASDSRTRTWLPYTLRRPFLVCLALVSLVLASILVILSWYSATHHGLRKDDGSLGLLLGWRYTPTIVAVLFTLALVMTAEDVKRTEAFSRMAETEPFEARFTLLYVPKVWWKSVFEGVSRRRSGGHRRWVLTFSSLAAGISILILSPFSSSVLIAKEIAYQEPVQMQRHIPAGDGTIKLQPQRETYFQTISAYLYNASTSIWVDDASVILPFGPTGPTISGESLPDGLWETDTMILRLENECIPMSITEKIILTANYSYADTALSNDTYSVKSKGFRLRSADGCEVQMQTPVALEDVRPNSVVSLTSPDDLFQTDAVPQSGGIIWTNMSTTYISWQDLIRKRGPVPRLDRDEGLLVKKTFIYDLSDQCRGRDLLIVSPPWWTSSFPLNTPQNVTQKNYWDNFTVKAEVCTPTIYGASLPVQQSVTNGISRVRFDQAEFMKRRHKVPETLFDLGRLNDLAFHESWSKYMAREAGLQENQGFEGISMLLGKHYSLDQTSMLLNETFKAEASRLRSRFFGELVLSSVTQASTPMLENVDGSVTLTARRIMVVTEIAITLIVLFILAFCYSIFMLWTMTAGRRELRLEADPATIAGSTAVLRSQSSLATSLQVLSVKKRQHVNVGLDQCVYSTSTGVLAEVTPEVAETSYAMPVKSIKKGRPWRRHRGSKKITRRDWRPSMLHKQWLLTLLVVLVALATAILVLRHYSRENRLYRTAFVYQVDLGLFNASFSPHSVIAALVAVAIGLSWDGIDKPMRHLQPYLSMTRGTSAASRGVSLSYQSSYWLWVATRAALRRHWILSMIATGTTLAQILIISMAAIFERKSVIHAQPTTELNGRMYSYALRQEPFSFQIGLSSRPFYLAETLLETSEADWLYTALDEITLRNTPPAWTKDEWIYTPVSISRLPNTTTVSQDTGSENTHTVVTGLGDSPANVTVTTTALRGRLACSNIPVPATGWLDRAEDVFKNRTNEPIAGWILPQVLFQDRKYKSPVFTVPRRMACCTNGTAPGGQSVISFWSSGNPMAEQRPSEPVDPSGREDLNVPSIWSSNFTIKWIVGLTSSTVVDGRNSLENHVDVGVGLGNETLLYFTEQPLMSMMSCSPIIEHANASITISRSTSQVLEAKILTEPQSAPGAWDYPWDNEYLHPAIEDVPKDCSDPNQPNRTCSTFTTQESRGNASYGHFFVSQLLTAPHIVEPLKPPSWLVFNKSIEDVSNERFSIRDSNRGINMDFMSYANFHLAKSNATALLNDTALFEYSEKTFQTFFKHFATTGKWTYGGPAKSSVYDNDYGPGSAEEVNGTFTERIEVLAMNETATWLSLSIIFILIAILIVLIASLQIVYPKDSMQHRIECLADVLLMTAGSDEFVNLVHEKGVAGLENSDFKTKLGWFKDKRGVVRWGVEIADGHVEWVNAPEKDVDDSDESSWKRFWKIFDGYVTDPTYQY